jgi:hypothetical protein
MSREIEKEMVAFLDRKLSGDGLTKDAILRKDARTVFRRALECCVGIREKGGNNRGPMVELIQETIGSSDKEPWCMSLIQTGLAYAELKTGLASPIVAGEHCLTVWNETPKKQRVADIPTLGAICIWRHGSSTSGHTGATVSDVSNGWVNLVEGNTESGIAGGEVVRDGGGVYLTHRSTLRSGNMKVVGFLKPF